MSEYDANQFLAIAEIIKTELTAAQSEAKPGEKVYIGSLSLRGLKEESRQKWARPEFAPNEVMDYQTAHEVAEYRAKKAKQSASSDVGF